VNKSTLASHAFDAIFFACYCWSHVSSSSREEIRRWWYVQMYLGPSILKLQFFETKININLYIRVPSIYPWSKPMLSTSFMQWLVSCEPMIIKEKNFCDHVMDKSILRLSCNECHLFACYCWCHVSPKLQEKVPFHDDRMLIKTVATWSRCLCMKMVVDVPFYFM
jgi:hypothetical protein